jgi:pimeloyl-ACP methyl ester carboxylesterase
VHTLLRRAGVSGPYVLASSRGPDARAFIARYPGEVQGLVLADSSGDGGVRDFLRTLGPQRPGESHDVTDFRQVLRDHGPDQDYLRASDQAVSHDGHLGHLPLIVISRGEDNQWPASFSPSSVRRALEADVMRRQDQLAGLSSNSTHLIARQSGVQAAGMF